MLYLVQVLKNHSHVAESIGQLLGPSFNENVKENCDARKPRGKVVSKVNVVQVTLEQARQILAKWPKSVCFYREESEEKSSGAGRPVLIEVNKKDLSGQNQRLRDLTKKTRRVKSV